MKLKKIESFFFFILSIVIFSLAFPTMLEVFHIPNTHSVILPIVLFCLIAFFIQSILIKLPLYIVTILTSLYVTNGLMADTSILLFSQQEYDIMKAFFTFESADYPSAVSYFLLLLLLLLLVECQIVWKKVLLVCGICVGYLMLLNVFNEISVVRNVILILLLSLLLKGLLNYGVEHSKIFLVSSLVLLIMGTVTVFLPTDPVKATFIVKTVSYRNYMAEKGLYRFIADRGSSQFNVTGFGENDSRLGGSIADDFTVQFIAKQKSPHYWKVDSKSLYTGEGWEKANQEVEVKEIYTDEVAFQRQHVSQENQEEVELSLLYSENFVPTTYGDLKLTAVNNNLEFYKNNKTDRVSVLKLEKTEEIEMEVVPLDYEESDLPSTTSQLYGSDVDYFQLPREFPERIRELTMEITENKMNKIEKVKAVEDYLKNNDDFRYSKEETSYPNDGQDYVEHFLFDTQIGYCDNFSTAMAVMLRSVNIPTRWVKGFNSGTKSGTADGLDIYKIRNSNAHSWVEVYFDDYGWLPFEPTPSFTQPSIQQDEETSSSSTTQSSEMLTSSSQEESTETTTRESQTATSSNQKINRTSDVLKQMKPYLITIGLVVFVILVYLLIKYWLLLYLLITLKHKKFSFSHAYPLILRKAETKMYREKNQSLISYAKEFEEKYPQFKGDFSYLTTIYEAQIYGDIISFKEADKETVKRISYLLHKKL